MPYQAKLIENNRAVLLEYTVPLSPSEIQQSGIDCVALLDTAQDRVHIIVDLTGFNGAPAINLKGYSTDVLHHRNTGKLIIAVTKSYIRTIANTVLHLAGFENVFFVASMAEALEAAGISADVPG